MKITKEELKNSIRLLQIIFLVLAWK